MDENFELWLALVEWHLKEARRGNAMEQPNKRRNELEQIKKLIDKKLGVDDGD